MSFFEQLFKKVDGLEADGKFILTSDATIQIRRAQNIDSALATAIRGTCETIPYLIACYLLDARKPGTDEIALIIAVTLEDEALYLDWVGQQFQLMLKRFPTHASKTFIMSSEGVAHDYAGAEFFVRRSA